MDEQQAVRRGFPFRAMTAGLSPVVRRSGMVELLAVVYDREARSWVRIGAWTPTVGAV